MKPLFFVIAVAFSITHVNAAKHDPAPFPSNVEKVDVRFVSGLLKKGWEIPAGSYTDEERRTIFTGHQKGINASMLFGAVGVIVANQANKAGGKAKSKGMSAFSEVNIEKMLQEKIRFEFDAAATGFCSDEPVPDILEFCPYIILNRSKKEDSKIYAICVVQLRRENEKKPAWRARFYSEVVQLYSDEQLQDGNLISASLDEATERLAWCIRKAVRMEFSQYKPTKVNARFAGMPNDKLQSVGVLLDEQNNYNLLRVNFGFFPGYNVIHSDSLRLTPVKKFKDIHRDSFEAALN